MIRLRSVRISGPVPILALGLAVVLPFVIGGTARAQPVSGAVSDGNDHARTPMLRNRGAHSADLVKDKYIVVLKDNTARLDRVRSAATQLAQKYRSEEHTSELQSLAYLV